jgi:hypothetical protein
VFPAEAPEEASHLDDLDGIEAANGLIEHDEGRFMDNCLRNSYALFETVGQSRNGSVRDAIKLSETKHFRNALCDVFTSDAA